jgi:hypothetical protein
MMVAFNRRKRMIANHIHDALGQVDQLRSLILERRRFGGYSGTARMLGGLFALMSAVVLARVPGLQQFDLQLVGWGVVLAAGLALNYGFLAWWFLRNHFGSRRWQVLMPTLELFPALALGGVFTVALVMRGDYDLLFGTWMCFFGLAHMGYRHSLPRGILFVGLYYQVAGACCLVLPQISFLNPLPMGVIFFAGEMVGGWILRSNAIIQEGGSDESVC